MPPNVKIVLLMAVVLICVNLLKHVNNINALTLRVSSRRPLLRLLGTRWSAGGRAAAPVRVTRELVSVERLTQVVGTEGSANTASSFSILWHTTHLYFNSSMHGAGHGENVWGAWLGSTAFPEMLLLRNLAPRVPVHHWTWCA